MQQACTDCRSELFAGCALHRVSACRPWLHATACNLQQRNRGGGGGGPRHSRDADWETTQLARLALCSASPTGHCGSGTIFDRPALSLSFNLRRCPGPPLGAVPGRIASPAVPSSRRVRSR